MESAKVLLISELLRRRRPISGASSICTTPPPGAPPAASGGAKTHNPSASSSTKVLKPFSEPSIIIGTLSLPTFTDYLSSNPSSSHSCFSFSDDSGSVCCEVIDFDLRMIGKKIHILAWTFIPFKQCGGFLEIIKWKFPEGFVVSVDSFPLVPGDSCKDSFKAQHSVSGVLESVSPVSSLPCLIGSDGNAGNLCGFIAEILSCGCMLCKLKNGVNNFDKLIQGNEKHSFIRSNFVYFSGTTSSWYPAVLRLIGNVIMLSGLRKKLVYVGEEEAQLMLVSTKATCLRFSKLQNKGIFSRNPRDSFQGEGELGMYLGVVRNIYMQGMLIELDEEIWLLLTDQLIVLPHGVRVGTVLIVRNVHVVNPKFLWRKMLILGTCYKTNISIVSFSPLETGCQLLSHSQSLLRRFMESLVFPARLWVLLVVQCLRKKFSGAFSDKEILGSKHKEGLVEAYARSMLPPSDFRSRHSMFMEFCKHDSCGSGGNVSYSSLSLAVPFSNFIHNCDRMWIISLLQMKNGLGILEDCSQVHHPFLENRLSDQSIRRILPSRDIGVSLLGNLKMSPTTGRLQLIDATGSIDVVVPDLPSTWDLDAVYEVIDYSVVLEGTEVRDRKWINDDDLFSCGSIFCSVTLERVANLAVYVHFAWSNVIFRDFPNHGCPSSKDSSVKLDHGTFHLLWLAHKFPVQSQFQNDLLISGKCSSFAEVMVLPCELIIAASEGTAPPASIPQNELENIYRSCSAFKRCKTCHAAFKRCKTAHASTCIKKVGSCDNLSKYGNRFGGDSSSSLSLPLMKKGADNISGESPLQVPCAVTVRSIYGQSVAVSGILCFTQDKNCDILDLTSPRTLLLEFSSENLFKYKLLHIGDHYIMKHCAVKCFCDSNDMNSGSKVVVNLETHLWSLSFHFNEVPSGSCISESSYRRCLQNELLLHRSSAADPLSFYDVSVIVTEEAISLLDLDLDLQSLMDAILNPYLRSRDIYNIFEPVGYRSTIVSLFQAQGTSSGNHLPQGNLISLVGTVVGLHSGCCSTDGVPRNGAAGDVHLQEFTHEGKLLICLHVLTDGHMVQIDGCLSKHDYPVGLGPGADATFHRILAFGGQDRLRLMPVSVITVNSVRGVSSPPVYSFCSVPEDTVASCSISGLIQCDASELRKFRCRVVAVHIVMLERNRNLDKLLSDIPLAGFVLDDGSSQCCCWANGARAATFLRLHEEISQLGFGNSWWRSNGTGVGKACRTPCSYLDKILKRHGRVTVKNYGSIHESLCQNLQLSVGSDNILGSNDENLLKFIILNACSSRSWSMIGQVMDSSAVNALDKYLTEEQMNVHALKNVWAREVCHVDTVAEARALYQDM